MPDGDLPGRWTPLRPHPIQAAYFDSPHRFNVVSAGRRCLAEGTLVATPSGPRAIETLQIGDTVWGFDSIETIETTVTATWDNGPQEVIELVEDGHCYLEATAYHKLWARSFAKDSEYARTYAFSILGQYKVACAWGYPDLILSHGSKRVCSTYDVTVSCQSNLYVLHDGGIITSNSGKTELAKRRIVRAAAGAHTRDDERYFVAAPTRDQAKQIFWADMKRLVPRWMIARAPSETELSISLINGSEIHVVGMDRPARIEGRPWNGGVLDEYGNMRPEAWPENVRPALADRGGWCDFIGVPEGMNHYHDLDAAAAAQFAAQGAASDWRSFTWLSATVLPEAEVEAARRDLHPQIFRQEYEGAWVNWSGTAFFLEEYLLEGGAPVPVPPILDCVFGTIDCAVKDGAAHDSTAAVYWGLVQYDGRPRLVILDWEVMQVEASLLVAWLPAVLGRLEQLCRETRVRSGSLGAFIEDAASGSILLQQARQLRLPATAIDARLTAMGKDGRAFAISGLVFGGAVRLTAFARDKVVDLKGQRKNHLLSQVTGFRVGDPGAAKRADDLADAFMYGILVGLREQVKI